MLICIEAARQGCPVVPPGNLLGFIHDDELGSWLRHSDHLSQRLCLVVKEVDPTHVQNSVEYTIDKWKVLCSALDQTERQSRSVLGSFGSALAFPRRCPIKSILLFWGESADSYLFPQRLRGLSSVPDFKLVEVLPTALFKPTALQKGEQPYRKVIESCESVIELLVFLILPCCIGVFKKDRDAAPNRESSPRRRSEKRLAVVGTVAETNRIMSQWVTKKRNVFTCQFHR